MFWEIPSVDMPHFVGFNLQDFICVRNIIDSVSSILFFPAKEKRKEYEFW